MIETSRTAGIAARGWEKPLFSVQVKPVQENFAHEVKRYSRAGWSAKGV